MKMKDLIHAFPDNIKEAIAIAEASELKKPSNKITNIVLCKILEIICVKSKIYFQNIMKI